jgi:hypothetical protein
LVVETPEVRYTSALRLLYIAYLPDPIWGFSLPVTAATPALLYSVQHALFPILIAVDEPNNGRSHPW